MCQLEDAQILVCIGRGLNKKEDLPLVETLANFYMPKLVAPRPLSP